MYFVRNVVGLFFLCVFGGCAGRSTDANALHDMQDFPRPAALKDDPTQIRLGISIDRGEIVFTSLNAPEGHDIHLGTSDITMETGDRVLLHAREIDWNLGETTVTLKDSKVLLVKHLPDGKFSQIIYAPAGGFMNVTCDGVFQKSCREDIVQIAADSGKITGYCQLRHAR